MRLHVSCHLNPPFCLGPGNARNPKLDTSHVVRLILRAAHLCVPLWLRPGGANAGCPAMRARRGWGVGRMQLGEASLQCLALGSDVFSLARWWRRPLRRDDQRALYVRKLKAETFLGHFINIFVVGLQGKGMPPRFQVFQPFIYPIQSAFYHCFFLLARVNFCKFKTPSHLSVFHFLVH